MLTLSLDLNFCGKIKDCGHACKGVPNEEECLPCMNPQCLEDAGAVAEIQPQDLMDMSPEQIQALQRKPSIKNKNTEENCNICHTDPLGAKPMIILGCRHVYHANCVL